MGALPNVYPGYQPVNVDANREKVEKAWGVSLPAKIGLKIPEMFEAAHKGTVKAMYILGENPVLTGSQCQSYQGSPGQPGIPGGTGVVPD